VIGPTTRLIYHVCGIALGLAAVAFGFGVWRLSIGPVSLAILAPYVEESLNADNPNFRFYFEDLVLSWQGWERILDVRATDVSAYRTDAAAMVEVPEMGIGISIPALFRGLIAPTKLELFGLSVRVVRGADGKIDLGFANRASKPDKAVGNALFEKLLLPLDRDLASGYLRHISIVEGHLLVRDEGLNIDWSAPVRELLLERHENGVRSTATLSFAVGEEEIELDVGAQYRLGESRFDLSVKFDRLVPAVLAAVHPDLANLAEIELPLSGHVDFVIGVDGELGDIVFDFSGGPGRLALPLPIAPAAFQSIVGLRTRGQFDGTLSSLALDRLLVDFGDSHISMNGTFSGDWSAPDTKAEIRFSNIPIDSIDRYWPASVAANRRSWVIERMSVGSVSEMSISLDLDMVDWSGENLSPDAVIGLFRIVDTEISYMPDMPPVAGVEGVGRFDSAGLVAEVHAGSAGPLAVHSADVSIDAEDGGDSAAEIDVVFSGRLDDALAALDRPLFGYMREIGLSPTDISGSVQGELSLALPLLADTPLSRMTIGVSADLFDLAISGDALGGFVEGGMRDGQAALLLDSGGFDLSGEGLLAGTPAQFYWRENFSPPPDSLKRRLDVGGRIDDADRVRAGLDSAAIHGPLDVELRLIQTAAGALTGELDIDGKAATLSLPEVDWHKPAGAQAEARLALEWEEGTLRRLTQFGLLAEGLSVAGSAERDAAGVWIVGFDRVAAGLTDIRGSVRLGNDGHLVVGVSGSSLDLRSLLAHLQEAPDAAGVLPIDLNAAVDLVVIGDETFLHQVTAQADYDGRRVTRASLDFTFGEARDLSLRLASAAPNQRVAVMTSANGGAVIAALGLTSNMVGGAMQVEAAIDGSYGDAPITGTFEIDDFYIVEAPVLARILSAVSITGALEMLGGDGMPFDRLNAPFSHDGSVVHFDEARAYGLSFGITMEGDIDLDQDSADLKGTIVPAYMLNTVLGNIPVIGDLLTGGEGKGVFAATYKVKGPLESPQVTVNPLAALAPGILRELFGGFVPNETGDTGPTDSRTR